MISGLRQFVIQYHLLSGDMNTSGKRLPQNEFHRIVFSNQTGSSFCSSLHLDISMHKILVSVICPLLLCLAAFGSAALGFAAEQNISDPKIEAGKEVSKQAAGNRDISELTPKITALSKKLLDMQAQFAVLKKAKLPEERLITISQLKESIEEQIQELEANSHDNLQQLFDLQTKLLNNERKVAQASYQVTSAIAKIDHWIDFWDREKEEIFLWEKGLGTDGSLSGIQGNLQRLQQINEQALKEIDLCLKPLLELQTMASETEISMHSIALAVEAKLEDESYYSQSAPYLFSFSFIKQFNPGLWQITLDGIRSFGIGDYDFLYENKQKITLAIILFFILSILLVLNRQWQMHLDKLAVFRRRPIAVSLLVSLCFFFLISIDIPQSWLGILRLFIILSALRLSYEFLFKSIIRRIVVAIMLVLLVTNLLVMIALPMALMRLFVFCICVLLMSANLYLSRKLKNMPDEPAWLLWSSHATTMLLGTIIMAELAGQADLSYYIFVASSRSLFAVISVWIIYMLIDSLVTGLLQAFPIRFIKDNANQIRTLFRTVLFSFLILIFAVWLLVAWRVFPNFPDAVTAIGSQGVTLGNTKISIRLLLSAALVLYLSYWISRLLQTIMLYTVMPRQNIEHGIQLSIIRLIHYAIMLIGFLLALGTLGFSLTNLTVIGGALGIGIGFGLQAIVNNFASGLILLFERPIKVGDTIAIGEELGEVKELGLRATVVQTFDDAEIVVPNSDLVTGQVVNWTLKGRRVRLRVTVGVAYGSDVEKVLKILLDCAHDHPQILSTPKPIALFLAFGASSLDFELRAFIPEFSDRFQVLSDINQKINREFALAGIEVPYSQHDLHLKSIDSGIPGLLRAD